MYYVFVLFFFSNMGEMDEFKMRNLLIEEKERRSGEKNVCATCVYVCRGSIQMLQTIKHSSSQ